MTTPAAAQRKIKELGSDVLEIYGLLQSINDTQQEHGRHLGGLGDRLDGVQGELTHIGAAQLRQGARLDQLDRNLMGVNERLDAVDDQFERVDDRLTIVEEKLDRQDGVLAQHSTKLDQHGEKLDQILDLLRTGRAETP